MSIHLNQRPLLSRAARLRFDARSRSYVLLSPERGLRLNATASAVVRHCTGELTVQEIICALGSADPAEALAKAGSSEPCTVNQVTEDVLTLLAALTERRLVIFKPDA